MTTTVDSHVHFWDDRHTPQPWMTHEHKPIARPFAPGELRPLLRRNGIDAVIVVQGACLDSDTDRLMCGSDWPVALLNGHYDRVWHAVRKAAEVAAPDCADALLGSNACRIYRLEVPASAA
jgi:predicted TIM-barrel fold metal-dependent hydrolase